MQKRDNNTTSKGAVMENNDDFIIAKSEEEKSISLSVQQEKELFFFKMTSEKREEVKRWLENEKKELHHRTEREKAFLKVLEDGLKSVKYIYWISTIEPTMNKETEKIEFIKGAEVARGYSCEQWDTLGEEFMPERGSRSANLYELFIWYAWRIVKGYWTLSYVSNNLSREGKYEVSAKRKVGGFRDGIGNTCKIVTYGECGHMLVGVHGYFGNFCVIGEYTSHNRSNSSGVIVLTK